MKTNYRNSFVILLGTVAVMSLHASKVQPTSNHNDQKTSLEKCITYLDRLQARFVGGNLHSRQISTLEDCSDAVENIHSYIASPAHHRLQMLLDPTADDVFEYSKKDIIPAAIGKRQLGDNLGKTVSFPNRDEALYSQSVYPKLPENIAGKLAQIRNTLGTDFVRPVGSDTIDITDGNSRSGEFTRRELNNAMKLSGNFLNRLRYLSNQSQTSSAINGPKEKSEGDLKDEEDGATWDEMAQHAKRASGDWLNAVNTEVAKRRRATLSINNALMALTDMVMEHGREKQMRNRDNLKYHMFVQG